MAKQSALEKAIAAVGAKIDVLVAVRDELIAQRAQQEAPKRVRPKPRAVPKGETA